MKNEKKFVEISKSIWEKIDSPPERFTCIKRIKFRDLVDIFDNCDFPSFKKLVKDVSSGAFLIIEKCFNREEVEFIKNTGIKLMKNNKSSFHKMDSEIPNFWRDITSEHSKKYGVPVVKKSMYFFHWNDEKELFKLVNKRWDIMKILSGGESSFGKYSFPKDGFVDRIQLVQYPSGTGFLAAHQDPDHNSRCFISGYMSKIGVDFKSGGFWALNKNNEKVNLEQCIEVGDFGLGSARFVHGVDQIDDGENSERWWLGLYTNDSDCVKNRKTLESPKINV